MNTQYLALTIIFNSLNVSFLLMRTPLYNCPQTFPLTPSLSLPAAWPDIALLLNMLSISDFIRPNGSHINL